MSETDKSLGKKLRQLREGRGLSQQIQKYEAGINRISCSRLLKILDVLDISIIDFFAGIKVSDHLIISEEECQLFNAYRQKNPQTRRAILTLLGNPN